MYIRIYPSRNNTIFKRTAGGANEVLGLVNTGKNTIFELNDGNTESAILMNFDISSIKTLLESYPYTCTLKMWDAGVVFEPTITLKTIDLVYFKEEFTEGDGFQFLGPNTVLQASNWIESVTGTPWSPAQPATFATGLLPALQLNEANEDLSIPLLEPFIADFVADLTPNIFLNFGIRISTNDLDEQTFTKFLYSRHTRTIFKPYLEFEIADSIIDNRNSATATQVNNIFLLNESGQNFVGTTVTCEITDNTDTVVFTPTVLNPQPGVYQVVVTPTIAMSNTLLFDNWKIDGVDLTRNVINVKSPNQVMTKGLEGLFFYPVTNYSHPVIRQNDVVLFECVSQIRGKGAVILPGFEFRVVSTSAFEMQPWTPVNVYNNKMFFHVDTSYFFPGLEYEVFVRLTDGKSVKTSAMTYKFRLQEDSATHLRDLQASPYNSRDYLFYK